MKPERVLEAVIDDMRKSNELWRYPVDEVCDMILGRFIEKIKK